MPDIAMCSLRECPIRKQCYCYRAIPTPGKQAYGGIETTADNNCPAFWPIENREVRPMGEIEVKK